MEGRGIKGGRREWSRKPGRENGGMWTRVWLKIGDEFANVCKRAIQHWCRVAEQEGRERAPVVEVEWQRSEEPDCACWAQCLRLIDRGSEQGPDIA